MYDREACHASFLKCTRLVLVAAVVGATLWRRQTLAKSYCDSGAYIDQTDIQNTSLDIHYRNMETLLLFYIHLS